MTSKDQPVRRGRGATTSDIVPRLTLAWFGGGLLATLLLALALAYFGRI